MSTAFSKGFGGQRGSIGQGRSTRNSTEDRIKDRIIENMDRARARTRFSPRRWTTANWSGSIPG